VITNEIVIKNKGKELHFFANNKKDYKILNNIVKYVFKTSIKGAKKNGLGKRDN